MLQLCKHDKQSVFHFVQKVSKWMTFTTVTLSNSVSTTGLDVFDHVGILALCFMGIELLLIVRIGIC